jgi:hypothetical protein
MPSFPWRLAKSERKRSNVCCCWSFWQGNLSVERCHKFACALLSQSRFQFNWNELRCQMVYHFGSQVDLRNAVDKFLEYLMGPFRWLMYKAYKLSADVNISLSVHHRTIYRITIWRYFHEVKLLDMVNNFFRYTAVFLICTMHEELRMRYFALFVVILSLRQIGNIF